MYRDPSLPPISVVVVDDDPIVRSALVSYVAAAPTIAVLDSCDNGAEALAVVESQSVDVVVMDVRMPVMDGITATRRITNASPHTKVLLLTSFDEDSYMIEALRAGASGFLLKDTSPTALVDAVHTVHEGTTVVSPKPMGRLVRHEPGPDEQQRRAARPKTEVDLSARELQILSLLCQAHSNAEIAAELYLSESTVKTHVSTLMSKLMVNSRLKAVVRAYEWGLVYRDGDGNA
ncbi:response regulator [Nigerium massiliense]|uniref:response regulator n=1 Tax=Nigerium massiliense TaxID=1522317 RepID=UPI00058F73BF|nr:response regulator transcription factor [Nigerium massiliense]